ncbi:MBOAT family O-acyltransferase [Flavivirga aquimarina]|uniref:MBOAT family O-acyltransferase n=1 Tax=Flavivirga aquimarina TaxID=2027862 RepID=A0ABT8W8N3_9FLAO|nr:MBOAT family O-acyltransferase [Flavivirga aquimarina]MDO5969486.1 MBOAT family O-acyltransferase [Flavivirga aquimarina]
MLFNSFDFAIFLPIVFIGYWFLFNKTLKIQNLFILVSSYFFYGCWDWRFLSLILFSTIVDYLIGIGLSRKENITKRKLLLWISILMNLGFLGFFKYYNFFLHNFITAFSFFGKEISANSLDIILPVGISFYTFQTLSYTIDVYKRKLEPIKDFIAFSAFVSFFPQLVAGPIERATNLLPQFQKNRIFKNDLAIDGVKQILWGLFKKVVIADNCAFFCNEIFNNSSSYNGSTLVLGAIFFSFQIYGDFSGYSDIAIGVAKLFGFKLMKNFLYPYFSRDIAEFWRRWHISLTTWFRDYLYIPLGGSRASKGVIVRNVLIVFLVSGFWHGANWTFLFWGGLNGLLFLPLIIQKKNRKYTNDISNSFYFLPSFKEFFSILSTFALVTLCWVFFRAESLTHAFQYLNGIFSDTLFEPPLITFKLGLLVLLIFYMITIEWFGRFSEHPLKNLVKNRNIMFKISFYSLILILTIWFSGKQQDFIYFQF